MTIKENRDIKRKLNVINYAKKIGNVKNGSIGSENELIGNLQGVSTNAEEEHNNMVTEGTKENTKMNNYVKSLNKNEGTYKYNEYYEQDKKKYR